MGQEVVQFLLSNLVFLFMLATGLETDLRQVARESSRPGTGSLFARALLVLILGIPVLALAVTAVVPIPLPLKGLLLLIAVCPGKPFFLKSVRKTGASIPASVSILTLLVLAAPLTVPFWVSLIGQMHGFALALSPLAVFGLTTKKVLLPLALGLVIRRFWPRIAEPLGVFVDRIALAALLIGLGVVLAFGVPSLGQLFPGTLVAMIVIVAGSLAMGHWAGGPRPGERAAVGFATVSGDPTLVLAIVAQNFPDARIQAQLAACLIVRALLLVPYQRWLKHRFPATSLGQGPLRTLST